MSEAHEFELVVANPEGVVFEGLVVQLLLRSAGGDIAFLAGHGPYVGEVEVCLAVVQSADGGSEQIVVDGGVVRAGGNRVIVLARDAELASSIEQESLRRRRERYETRLQELDDATAEAELRGLELRGALL